MRVLINQAGVFHSLERWRTSLEEIYLIEPRALQCIARARIHYTFHPLELYLNYLVTLDSVLPFQPKPLMLETALCLKTLPGQK